MQEINAFKNAPEKEKNELRIIYCSVAGATLMGIGLGVSSARKDQSYTDVAFSTLLGGITGGLFGMFVGWTWPVSPLVGGTAAVIKLVTPKKKD